MGFLKTLKASIENAKVQTAKETVRADSPVIEFINASASHYREPLNELYHELNMVLVPREGYGLPDKQLLAKYGAFREGRMRLFKFDETEIPCKIQPDPSNHYDKNAIKILAKASDSSSWIHVGYFAEGDAGEVRRLIKAGYKPRIIASKGPYKYSELLSNGHHEVIETDYGFYLTIELFKE